MRVETGTPPAELGAEVIVGASVGAKRTRRRFRRRRIVRLVQILKRRLRRRQRLSTTVLLNSRWTSLCTLIAGESQADEQEAVNGQAHQECG